MNDNSFKIVKVGGPVSPIVFEGTLGHHPCGPPLLKLSGGLNRQIVFDDIEIQGESTVRSLADSLYLIASHIEQLLEDDS